MTESICITAISSISPLGISMEEIWAEYQISKHLFCKRKFGKTVEWIAPLSRSSKMEIERLRNSDSKYKKLDESVLFAIYVSRNAIKKSGWNSKDKFGINIGSSRGATSLFEKYHEEYIKTQRTGALASPTTTLGNISSWVAHDLGSQGPEISHSITCSTALHALLNGVAWLKSGLADKFLVGGSEAPLTPFTLAQMKALKIYAKETTNLSVRAQSRTREVLPLQYPCRAFDLLKRQNSMVLGEAASMACLEKGDSKKSLATIEGIGYASEVLENGTSISPEGQCFQKSMKMALGDCDPSEVDAIVMHAPGTIKGDLSEFAAVKKVFGENVPALTTNKWKIGHTFGASGMLSIELAILMLQNQNFIKVPFVDYPKVPKRIEKIMVNAVGFGGNAVSILLMAPTIK